MPVVFVSFRLAWLGRCRLRHRCRFLLLLLCFDQAFLIFVVRHTFQPQQLPLRQQQHFQLLLRDMPIFEHAVSLIASMVTKEAQTQ